MRAIDHGEFEHPWHGPIGLTEAPTIHPSALVKRSQLGDWTVIGQGCQILDSALDDWSYAMEGVDIFNAAVGKFANIAARVRINPTNHPTWRATQHHFTYRSAAHHMGPDDAEIFEWRLRQRITIGPDVWIGHGAILLPGVSVGTGAAIGAGSVVTKPVPAYAIVAGNPARVIRRRVEPEIAAALLRIAWWDWSKERLTAALDDFRRLDAAVFAAKYDPARPG